MHNLEAILRYVCARRYNILIIIDSDYERVGERMQSRHRSPNDFLKGMDDNYNLAQTIAYGYFAAKLQLPCIDLAYLRHTFNVDDAVAFRVMTTEFKKLNRSREHQVQIIPQNYHQQDDIFHEAQHFIVSPSPVLQLSPSPSPPQSFFTAVDLRMSLVDTTPNNFEESYLKTLALSHR